MNLQPGRQRAILADIDYLQSPEKGTLGLAFTFNCIDDENKAFAQTQCRRWLTKKTAEYVMKDLLTCGLKEDVKDITVLAEEDAINKYFNQPVVSLVLEFEEYNGKQYLRVQWINEESGKNFEALSVSAAKKQIGGLNLKAMLAKTRKDNPDLGKIPEADDDGDEVPFGA